MNEATPQEARWQGVECRLFMERHAEYLDGFLDPAESSRFDEHAVECARCGRYDRVMRRGLLLARNLPEIEPSADFQAELDRRLRGVEVEPGAPIVADGRTAVLVAAVLAVIALTPLVPLAMRESEPSPGVVAPSPHPATNLPLLAPGEALLFRAPAPTQVILTTGPFTPVLVQAPMQGVISRSMTRTAVSRTSR